MVITLEEAKAYLRVDTEEEDTLLLLLLATAETLCFGILRKEVDEREKPSEPVRTAILYGTSYLYENRENADFKELTLTLKCLLFGEREDVF
ncbi:head-tail connector protein [Anaeromicropila populeti]|uniref:Uncharacterized phage protein (Possible DNA packaging) n=1 Tax=Anaeromicropila populeti TaxID=37658 RepID=A0A1I6LR46_9FIRM|nr:head-tail connector protein [Anaeromicropila populeti]SFS05977.1 uncharacterized phage protein (possible DNA packaging) [Anaeromicropila populeti]